MSPDRRNIVLVSIDSLRADHCGFLGDDRGLTPTMDGLAAEGVAFQNAVAPGPQTFSSMPTVFTGQHRPPSSLESYPQETHWERQLAAIEDHLRQYASLPERLQALGYDTAGVSPNPWTSTASGFDRGFDQFVDFSESSGGLAEAIVDRLPRIDTEDRSVELLLNLLSGAEFFSRWEHLAEEITRARTTLSEPYFLWVFLLDTHYPFLASRAHREEGSLLGAYYSTYRSSGVMRGTGDGSGLSDRVRAALTRSYRDTVRASDAFLDHLQMDLAEDDPVTIVHSDHGESFGEHGNYGHHHRQVYEENIHVPYLVHNADTTATVEAPTSLSTVHDVALEVARSGTVDPTACSRQYAISTSECGTYRAVRGNRFKYIDHGEEQLLFDLNIDPDKRASIATEWPDHCASGSRQLDRQDRQFEEAARIYQASRTLAASGQF